MIGLRELVTPRSYRNAVMALGPVGYWRLNEASGTVAKDETGAYDGTYINTPTLGVTGALAGDANTAVTFAAASSQSVRTAAPVTTVVDNWTMATWVQPTAAALTRTIIENGVGTGYSLLLNSSHQLWGLRDGASFEIVTATGPALSTTEPSFAVLMRRAGTSYIYLNGALSVTGNTGTPATPTTRTNIGVSGDATFPLDGTTDEAVIWDRALTDAEVATLYRIGRGF